MIQIIKISKLQAITIVKVNIVVDYYKFVSGKENRSNDIKRIIYVHLGS